MNLLVVVLPTVLIVLFLVVCGYGIFKISTKARSDGDDKKYQQDFNRLRKRLRLTKQDCYILSTENNMWASSKSVVIQKAQMDAAVHLSRLEPFDINAFDVLSDIDGIQNTAGRQRILGEYRQSLGRASARGCNRGAGDGIHVWQCGDERPRGQANAAFEGVDSGARAQAARQSVQSTLWGGILEPASTTAQSIRRCDTIPEGACLVTLRPRNVRRCATIPESPIHTLSLIVRYMSVCVDCLFLRSPSRVPYRTELIPRAPKGRRTRTPHP